jgi:hydroxymethylpyrimidine pyrophosphatase-like HAD family hydrolase
MIKAIFLDIDGTLIDGVDGPFPEDIEQIEAARESGCKVFLSTGRSLAALPPLLSSATWVDGVIAGCGAAVMLHGNMIYRSAVPRELLPKICRLYFDNGKWCVFEGETGVFGIGRYLIFDYGEPPIHICGVDDFELKYGGEIITKITMEGFLTDKERSVFEPELSVTEFAVYSEAVAAGETKAGGMDKILAACGLTRDCAVAIGDSENDLDIVKAAGLGVAMGNACAELKAVADVITGDAGKGGVAGAIKKYVLAAH